MSKRLLRAQTSFVLLESPGVYEIGETDDLVQTQDDHAPDADGWVWVAVTRGYLIGMEGYVNPTNFDDLAFWKAVKDKSNS